MIEISLYVAKTCFMLQQLFLHVIVKEGGARLSTVVTVMMLRHKAANSSDWTVLPETHNLTTVLYSVVLEGLERDCLVRALGLLRLGIDLLLALLSSSPEAKNQVERGFLLDVVVRESSAVLKLLSSKDETLLIRGDSLLVLDLSLHVIDRVRRLNIKRDGLTYSSSVWARE